MAPREYRGRLSAGCESCRVRRVKCDATKPKCNKCTTAGYGETCKYRDLSEITFRSENNAAAARAIRTWRSRAKGSNQLQVESSICDLSSSSSSSPGSGFASTYFSPEPPMALDVQVCAQNRLFFDYTIPNEHTGKKADSGIFDYMPDLFHNSPPESSLRAAVSAAALANFQRRSHLSLDNHRRPIDRAYGIALTRVQLEMQDPVLARSDELLLAIQLLGVYEVMSTGGNNPAFLEIHAKGMAALLKLRGIPAIATGSRFRLFNSINMQLLLVCLTRGIPSFFSYSSLQELYEAPKMMMGFSGLIHQSVNALAMLKASYCSSSSVDPAGIPALLPQLILLDDALITWKVTLSSFTAYRTFKPSRSQPRWLQKLLDFPGAPEFMARYESITLLLVWNIYRVTRISIARALLKGNQTLAILNQVEVTQRLADVERLVEDICSCVLDILTLPIKGKPEAKTFEQVCGFRSYMLMSPLSLAIETLRTTISGEEAETKARWLEQVLGLVMREMHKSRTE